MDDFSKRIHFDYPGRLAMLAGATAYVGVQGFRDTSSFVGYEPPHHHPAHHYTWLDGILFAAVAGPAVGYTAWAAWQSLRGKP
jgi:hypothetical protein